MVNLNRQVFCCDGPQHTTAFFVSSAMYARYILQLCIRLLTRSLHDTYSKVTSYPSFTSRRTHPNLTTFHPLRSLSTVCPLILQSEQEKNVTSDFTAVKRTHILCQFRGSRRSNWCSDMAFCMWSQHKIKGQKKSLRCGYCRFCWTHLMRTRKPMFG